ncbi:MAG: bifunctional UDP-N-acetylglucosamine diphosphorylase/glucosamine-1-phosphate N-acetyltransferase GlmU [Armatimonadota bacterium]|nr:bifunctional UDP-N-acetylglucosamine diphosphorylase/glucosamine-1-phosphate N-acetyltransferase GlmU [Armatimonadota bacterium]MDR7497588.1 bifunctional UDP-N-acetylglucosamine diphosphorylase/glucosamine-1-phosphate N-acetyltransferase GlmU [Armatimonadota bacterium]MDR7511104.1 bifunctional UDP-N-acetylglucosamine diphosphorylase/glucosamine-1-phosphate N-acetyltransferase GlmU [Armatimonadota bacterium]
MREVEAVVLAAGKGTRMASAMPKVLHPICGRPMIAYVLETLAEVGIPSPVVVVGHGVDAVRGVLGDGVRYAVQAEQLGTGHAVMQALPQLEAFGGTVLIVYGDVPFLRAETIRALLAQHREQGAAATILTDVRDDPRGYGRVIRDGHGNVRRIVEDTDASPEEREVREINAGMYAIEAGALRDAVGALQPANAQGEYYLTDAIAALLDRGHTVAALVVADSQEATGINSRAELARAEAAMRAALLDRLMAGGVTVVDPGATYVHAGVRVGRDTVLHPGTSLEGRTVVGEACAIGPQARLVDAEVGDRVTIVASTVTASRVGDGTRIGPYSHLRPGVRLGRDVEIGNFAELKNATVGDHTKVHHMSYLGDATVGARVNIGAGTVTCNFDGRAKHPTVIEDGAFIGSDTMLIAPVRVGRGAVTGAGAVVRRDVPAGGVAVGAPARVIRHVAPDEVPASEPTS